MRHQKSITLLIVILISLLASISSFGQFKGKMTFDTMDKERSFDVYYSDLGYRYEFNEDGQEGAVIVKSGSKEIIILMPQQKMAMKSSPGNPMSMANDPLQSFEYYKDSGIFKESGEEAVNGIPCKKSILYNKDNPSQKMFTMWFSEEYKFPMKMINHIDGSEESGMEMKDVKPWKPDPSMFEIPSGFNVMDTPGMMPKK
ncbi:MAG TPA: hypothetical protein VK870_06065 [Ignavibacteriaceae bacterium]|nr:hypothetical protein [Ignavibacteriaceae bacterium]